MYTHPNNSLLCLRLSLSGISVERSERYDDTLRLTGIVNKEDAKGHLDANLIKHAASYYLLGLEIPNPQHYSIKTSHSQTVVLKEKMWKAFNWLSRGQNMNRDWKILTCRYKLVRGRCWLSWQWKIDWSTQEDDAEIWFRQALNPIKISYVTRNIY